MQTIVLIHIIFAILFLLIFGAKIVLMLTGQDETLESLNKATKVPNMIVGTVFLATGIYLLVKIGMGNLGGWFHLKLTLVLIAIPMAIISLKKKKKIPAVLSLLLFLYVYALAETKSPTLIADNDGPTVLASGEIDTAKLWKKNCKLCHGNDGDRGLSDAPMLSKSVLEREKIIEMVRNGKNVMPAFGDKLNNEEIEAVADYALSLRKQ